MKLKFHPLFFLLGILSAVFGKLLPFITCTLTALLHECGHVFYANRLGFSCSHVRLMPYGAAASLNIEGLSWQEELKLALSGPLVNACLALACAGLWWFFPQTYAYTDVVFLSNVAMLAVNLLPAYPLDGGRVVGCLCRACRMAKRKDVVPRIGTVVCAVALVVAGLVLRNLSLLILGIFLPVSLWERSPSCFLLVPKPDLSGRGKEVKYVAITPQTTYRQAFRHLQDDRYLVLQCLQADRLEEVTQDELLARLRADGLDAPVIPPYSKTEA